MTNHNNNQCPDNTNGLYFRQAQSTFLSPLPYSQFPSSMLNIQLPNQSAPIPTIQYYGSLAVPNQQALSAISNPPIQPRDTQPPISSINEEPSVQPYVNNQRSGLGVRQSVTESIVLPSLNPDQNRPPSALFQMLGGSTNRVTSSATDGGASALPQDQTALQGPGILNQLNSIAEFMAENGDYAKAIEYYERIINIDTENGAAWTALGHCYLLINNLQKAQEAYQKALYSLQDIRDPQLWYGIGILYEKVNYDLNIV